MSGFFDFQEQMRQQRRGAAPTAAPPSASSPNPTASPTGGAALAPPPQPITVTQLTTTLDRAVRAGVPSTVHVRGEISNYRPHQASGHLYFTLKDAVNCVDCVMWKSEAERLKFSPAAGMEMIASGNVKIWGRAGKYQLYVSALRPLGKGALELAFQQLRAKLEAQGLFDADRKKPLPPFPRTVALVTGANTAALQDMLKVLRRFASLRLLLYPVAVQGEGAAPRIAAALSHLSRHGEDFGIDVILLARGGGSLEDLWPFNEEAVARAIAASRLPIVTGIGHEVDTSIADLVADHHAHTPTEAAQSIVTRWRAAPSEIASLSARLSRSLAVMLADARQQLASVERHEVFRRPLHRVHMLGQLLDDRQRAMNLAMTRRLAAHRFRLGELRSRLDRQIPAAMTFLRQRLHALEQSLAVAERGQLRHAHDRVAKLTQALAERHPRYAARLGAQQVQALQARLFRAARADLQSRREKLDATDRQLAAVSPQNVLRRGYSMTFRKRDQLLLREPRDVRPGERLITRFAEGQVESVADDPNQPTLFD